MPKTLIICRTAERADKIRRHTDIAAVEVGQDMINQNWDTILCLFGRPALNLTERAWVDKVQEKWLAPGGHFLFI